ncbi:hypothetical protein NKI48_35425, partial [Mesorhizobium sp. M0644]
QPVRLLRKPAKQASLLAFNLDREHERLAIFRAIEKVGLESIISKRADSGYRSGPSNTWLKAKYFEEADF